MPKSRASVEFIDPPSSMATMVPLFELNLLHQPHRAHWPPMGHARCGTDTLQPTSTQHNLVFTAVIEVLHSQSRSS